jgi:hypothetical protein
MKGLRYITDEAGKKTALVIELAQLKAAGSAHEFVEELEDTLDIILREEEKSEDWEKVKADLLKKA